MTSDCTVASALRHLVLQFGTRPIERGGSLPMLGGLGCECAVQSLELGWTAQRQGLGYERDEGERCCDRDEPGAELDQAFHSVVGPPYRPDAHDVSEAAGGDERREHKEHPGERNLAPPQHKSE